MDTLVLLIVAGAAIFLWEWWQRRMSATRVEELADTANNIEQVVTEIQELQQRLEIAVSRDDYTEAIDISERMLVLSDDHFADDPEVILPLLAALSNFYHLAGEPLKAMPYLQRSIPLREKFPALHADQADSFSQLADLHLQLGAPREALPLIRREIELRRRHGSPDELLLRAQCKLLSLNLEEPAMAEPLRRDITATAQKLDQVVVTNLANEANTIVNDALRAGRVRDAWAAAEHAALLAVIAQGPDDEITYVCRSNLAEMLRRNRRFEEAETQFLQLIADLEKRENNTEGLRIAYNNLALLYDECDRTNDATSWRERQMALLQNTDGNAGARFNALNNLAVSQANTGNNNVAAQTYADALALSPDGDGIDPRIWAETLNNYGITLVNLKRLHEAARLYKKVIERKKAGADIPMPVVAGSFNGLGIVSEQLGKLAQAQDMFERALAIKEKHLPDDLRSLETARHNLGSVYAQQGDAARAAQMAQQVLASREKRLGPEHPDTQSARRNLAAMATAFEPVVATQTEPATREDVDALMVQITGGELLSYATYDFGRARDLSVSGVLVPETQAFTLYRTLTRTLPHGWQCFIGSTRWLGEEQHEDMAELVAIQSVSQFDCLRVARTDAVNHALDTEDIIRTLQDYDRRFGISIYSASTDTVGFLLLRMPEDLDAFAQELLDFCMDLEDVELIKQMINSPGNRVELWWD